jgi:hypothetical protein
MSVRVCPVDPCPPADELSVSSIQRSSAPLLHMRLSFADGLFWSSVACCAFAQYCILRSVGGRRHVSGPESSTVPRPRFVIEMLWAVVPAIALAVLLVFTWRAMHPAAGPGDAPALVTELAP